VTAHPPSLGEPGRLISEIIDPGESCSLFEGTVSTRFDSSGWDRIPIGWLDSDYSESVALRLNGIPRGSRSRASSSPVTGTGRGTWTTTCRIFHFVGKVTSRKGDEELVRNVTNDFGSSLLQGLTSAFSPQNR